MTINEAGKTLIKREESLRLKAYSDGTYWAIGYGNRFYNDGTEVKKGDVITLLQAEAMFTYRVNEFSKQIKGVLSKSLNDNQFGAVLSYTWNRGYGSFKNSNLLKLINSGASSETVAAQFTKEWGTNQTYKSALIKRRAREAALYQSKNGVLLQNNMYVIFILLAIAFYIIYKNVKH